MRVEKRQVSNGAFRKGRSFGRTGCAVLASAAALGSADRAWAVNPNNLENAYWRFEDGTNGAAVDATTNDAVLDSANANNMKTASASTAPTFSGIVSTPIIPQTGLPNAVSLQFNSAGGGKDIFTNNKNINNPIIMNGFTLEASFKLGSVGGGAYQCIVGKDGMPTSSTLAPLEFKVRGDNSLLQIEILDGGGTERQVSSLSTIAANQWYHVAAVDTGSLLSLYVDSGNGAGYVLQGSTPVSGALDVGTATPWSIGRGFFNNAPADWINNGQVEEVRLSNTALGPSNFLFTPATGRWNVDASGIWTSPGNWQNGIPRVAGSTANLSDAISVPRTVTVDMPVTVGTLNFNNANGYLVSGSQPITIDMGSNTPGAINVTSGSHVVSAPVAFARDSTITVTNAADTLKLTGSLTASAVTLTKQGSGTLEVPNLTATGVNVNNGTLRITASGGTSVSKIGQVATSDPGALDLGDNKLITSTFVGDWTGFGYDGVLGMIQSGRNGGTWTGSGIVTSQTAALGPNALTTIAVAQAADIGKSSLGNVPVGPNDVLVMYTYAGDANLSGAIDGDDYARIDTGFTGQLTGYENGDFNYDGVINADDYFIIDRNYSQQGTPFSAGAALSSASEVPEPGAVGIAIMGLAMMRLRRCKSQG